MRISELKKSTRLPNQMSRNSTDGFNAILRRSGIVPIMALLFFSISYSEFHKLSVDRETIVIFTTISLIACGIHVFTHRSENWLRIDTVFITSFFVTNLQWPFMYAVADLTPRYGFQQRSLDAAGNYAVALATISLLSWLIGFAAAPQPSSYRRLAIVENWRSFSAIFIISIFWFSYVSGEDFFSRDIYTNIQSNLIQTVNGVSAYLFDITQTMASLALALVCYERFVLQPAGYSRRSKVGSIVMIVALLAYCTVFLIGGDRGQVIQILVGFALAMATAVRPVRLWELVVLTLSGFAFFTLVGIWRTGAEVSLASTFQEYGYWEVSANLAQSFVPLTQSILIVEDDGLSLGLLWLSQTVGVIPFAQQLMLSLTDLTLTDVSSSALITTRTLGENSTTGLGTSFVADIYLNFGLTGTIIIPAFFGMFCTRISIWLRGSGGFERYLLAIAFASFIVYIPRSSILFILKPMLWSIVAFWLVKMLEPDQKLS